MKLWPNNNMQRWIDLLPPRSCQKILYGRVAYRRCADPPWINAAWTPYLSDAQRPANATMAPARLRRPRLGSTELEEKTKVVRVRLTTAHPWRNGVRMLVRLRSAMKIVVVACWLWMRIEDAVAEVVQAQTRTRINHQRRPCSGRI